MFSCSGILYLVIVCLSCAYTALPVVIIVFLKVEISVFQFVKESFIFCDNP